MEEYKNNESECKPYIIESISSYTLYTICDTYIFNKNALVPTDTDSSDSLTPGQLIQTHFY